MNAPRSDQLVSRRTALAGLGAGTAALALAATHPAVAQDATPDAAATHPLVGAWLVAVPTDPSRTVALNTYGADGTVSFNVDNGAVLHGTWEATGPRTAALTVVGFARDHAGTLVGGLQTIRGSVEVDDIGQTFHTEGDEFQTRDGMVIGPFANAVIGTRITVQPAGTPVPGTPASYRAAVGAAEVALRQLEAAVACRHARVSVSKTNVFETGIIHIIREGLRICVWRFRAIVR